jgi:N-acetylmuramoyl-L-alanine amidase
MKKYLLYFLLLLGALALVFFLVRGNPTKKQPSIPEATTPVVSVLPTPAKPFVILLVPGHDTDTDCKNNPTCNSGAIFRNIYERDLVVTVANNISKILGSDPKYKVIVARDTKSWNPIFATYFLNNKQAILDFKNQHQAADKLLKASGQEAIVPDTGTHTTASQTTAIELYGINKWADENDVDLVIHLHFNSSPTKNQRIPGPYHGFDMFIPDAQRTDSATSRTIAEDIYDQLEKKFTPESQGSGYKSLYEDQSLIALGASNTLTKPAILIEYAYVYEKMLQTSSLRTQALEQMAEQTVAGIQDYVTTTQK